MTTSAMYFNGAFVLLLFENVGMLQASEAAENCQSVCVREGGMAGWRDGKKRGRKKEALVAPFPPQDRLLGN